MRKIAGLWVFAWIFGIADSSCIAGEAFDDRRPTEHICPITLTVMVDPVVAADGHSYERKAILQHLANSIKSLATGAPLSSKILFENHSLKTLIREWRPEIQGESSVLESRDADSIARHIRQEINKNADLLNSAKGQHIVAFLGNPGSGKSTLINFLAGKEIKASDGGDEYVLDDLEDKTAMAIGSGGGLETLYPKYIDVRGLRFFDFPGFNDRDGSERNLVNVAFTRQILLDAASVRLVFVAGQDQFTADRSASVKRVLNCLKQLFIVDQDINLVDESVFVITKVTCNENTELADFLVKKTDARDKTELTEQLMSWHKRNKIGRMFHPLREASNRGAMENTLKLVQEALPVKVHDINVNALYPRNTKRSLERLFINLIEGALARQFRTELTTLSDYERAINFYKSENFWQEFSAVICSADEAINLIKAICISSYNQAFRKVEATHEERRQAHTQGLILKRQTRIEDIEKRTTIRTREVVSSLVPSAGDDFADYKNFYDQVCGPYSINQLATEASERKIVRKVYIDFISQHNHGQMMRWNQRLNGIDAIEGRLLSYAREEEEKDSITMGPEIPLIPQGYEEIYLKFLNGVLIYRPQENSDAGLIIIPIAAALANPLEGTFDLSQCGNAGKHLRISTGYHKTRNEEDADKIEVWLAPRFIIQKERTTTARHFQAIDEKWSADAPIGIFWTRSTWDDLSRYNYLTSETFEALSTGNLFEKWCSSASAPPQASHSYPPIWSIIGRKFSFSFNKIP